MGVASAAHAAQCQTPVLTRAMISANSVSAASKSGMRQTNQKLLRGFVCVDTEMIAGKVEWNIVANSHRWMCAHQKRSRLLLQ